MIEELELEEVSLKNMSLRELCTKWSKTLDINCYWKILEYRNNFRAKLFWYLVLFASTCATAWLISFNVLNFLKYEVVTQTTLVYETPTQFPTLTFCDNNPLANKQAQILNDLISSNNVGTNDWVTLTKLAQMQASAPTFGDAKRQTLGLNTDQIAFTALNGRSFASDLHWLWSFDYGNCFQFNSGLNSSNQPVDLITMSREGRDNGPKIGFARLFYQNKYVTTFSQGMVLFVHNSSFKPTQAVFLEPGKETFVSVERTFTRKYPKPYSECIDLSIYSSSLHDYIVQSGRIYRQIVCFDLCIQQDIIQKCYCFHTAYEKLNASQRPCLNLSDYNCLSEVFKAFRVEECTVKFCPLECESVTYDLTLSSLVSPSETAFSQFFDNKVMSDLFNQSNVTLTYESFKESSVIFTVYYSSMHYTQIIETPKVGIFDLFTQIGASMGMFVSFSIFTFFELIEVLFLILIRYIR